MERWGEEVWEVARFNASLHLSLGLFVIISLVFFFFGLKSFSIAKVKLLLLRWAFLFLINKFWCPYVLSFILRVCIFQKGGVER